MEAKLMIYIYMYLFYTRSRT